LRRNNKDKDKDKAKYSEPFNVDDNKLDTEDTDKYTTDDDELLEEEKKLLGNRKKIKFISVYDLLGKPENYLNNNNGNIDKSNYVNLLTLLEKQNVLVHFNSDYTLKEKFDFIVNEVFNQFVEVDRNKSSKVFVYEDYHPEKYSEFEDDGEFN
jgi:hypothetical protein